MTISQNTFKLQDGTELAFPFGATTGPKVGRSGKFAPHTKVWVKLVKLDGKWGPAALVIHRKDKRDVTGRLGEAYLYNDADYAIDWISMNYLDENTFNVLDTSVRTTVVDLDSRIDNFVPRGRSSGGGKSGTPSPIIRFYAVKSRTTEKAVQLSINGVTEWWPFSQITEVGEMKGDGLITFHAFDAPKWLLDQNFGEAMTQKFLEARSVITARLVNPVVGEGADKNAA
ncbi:MAG: hypothetical protein Unbinned1190contig1000_35 [Prokaryotic dsDNA virus sp.]|nr:MAG: hypothetical protein Unbinned1190contig1000_35 [Prokaryotic dsDNA virus sp.]|tara:strand:+ start:3119 stop:3802 length:684 start_codon:yes stop_codon:yes gene_type:complete